MNFDLHGTAEVARRRARTCATDVVAPAAAGIDVAAHIPEAVHVAASAVLTSDVVADGVAWVVAIEELATGSAAAALVAAGAALGTPGRRDAVAQWPGLRGADADALHPALARDARGDLAVTAVIVGLSRAAVEHARSALRAARVAGAPREAAESSLADAATMIDGGRLLLWDAARKVQGGAQAPEAASMARLHALDATSQAVAAATLATDPDASRPGTSLERLTRDWSTVTRVFGAADAAQRAVAAADLPD